jgi:PAS domain-containing protein
MRQAWLSECADAGRPGCPGPCWLTAAWAWWFLLAVQSVFPFRNLYNCTASNAGCAWAQARNPPESWGIWGEVFEHYYRLQRRYYKRKKRLGRVIREFRESTAAMPDGTMVLGGEMRILWFNEAARELLRLSTSRDLGQSVVNLIRSAGCSSSTCRRASTTRRSFHLAGDDSRTLSRLDSLWYRSVPAADS